MLYDLQSGFAGYANKNVEKICIKGEKLQAD